MNARIRSRESEDYIMMILERKNLYPPTDTQTNKLLKSGPKSKRFTVLEREKMNQEIPTITTANYVFTRKYVANTIKTFLQNYNLKTSGSKIVMQKRLYGYLKLSPYAMKIQSIGRGYLIRQRILLHGPGVKNRSLCNNATDFNTLDDLDTIPLESFFSFIDADGFIYGFNILSMYQLMSNTNEMLNPYNRKPIDTLTINKFIKLIRILKSQNKLVSGINYIPDEIPIIIPNVRAEQLEERLNQLSQENDDNRISWILQEFNSELFPTIELGQIIKELTMEQQRNFILQLRDIWMFRSELTEQIKAELNPLGGLMFPRTHYLNILTGLNNNLMPIVLTIMEKVIWGAKDTEWNHLSEYFIIGALTLVSEKAAILVPWIYQSVQR